MAVKGTISLKDEATSTLKSVRKETVAVKEATKTTGKELRDTWDKQYKPTVDTTIATKSIKDLTGKANEFKKDLNAKIKVDNQATTEINKAISKLSAFGKMVVSPLVKIKNIGFNAVSVTTSKLIALGKRVFAPVVKIKDMAYSKLQSTIKLFQRLGSTVAKPIIDLKDKITSKLSTLSSKLKKMAGMDNKVLISLKDKVSSGLKTIGGKLASFAKSLVIPVTVAATVATAGVGMAVKSGMELEQQQLTIQHFIGATNKDMTEGSVKEAADTFTNALRENANATPFETGEVIKAGSRAVAITQGNTTQAMDMVRLAEDMAAASGGTASVGDAIEALADAKMGEMERLKSFGFKVSAEDFKQKGFEGVSKDLEDFYGGAASKLASTGAGLMSTISGKLKAGVSDIGLNILEKLKPTLTDIIGFIDMAMPHLLSFGSTIGDGIGNGIKIAKEIIPTLVDKFAPLIPPILSFSSILIDSFQTIAPSIMPVFDTIIDALPDVISCLSSMLPPFMSFIGTLTSTIQSIITTAVPVVNVVLDSIRRMLPVLQPIFSVIVSTIGNIVNTVLPPLGTAFSYIADIIVGLSPIVTSVFEGISAVIGNVVSGITGILSGGMDLISSIWSGNWQGIVNAFGTILGGIGEICKAPINAVIGIINGAIAGINSISVDIPDWVPMVGGEHWGMNLGEIPYLAKGGVVNKATTAVIGEAGKEAVVPLERNTGWMDPVISKIAGLVTGANTVKASVGASPMSAGLHTIANILQAIYNNMMSPVSGLAPAYATASANRVAPSSGDVIHINIAKVADTIDANDDADIDKVGEALAKKIIESLQNR